MVIGCRVRVYDRRNGVEPEARVAEPGVMGWSQRLGLQSQELWAGATEDMVLEPEAMV